LDGSIVYIRDRTLFGQGIAADGSRMLGEPVVIPGVPERKTYFGLSDATASVASGVIAYPMVDERPTQYRWLDRKGANGPTLARLSPPYCFGWPSPDGKRAVVKYAAGIETNLWLLDLTTGESRRLTPPPWKSREPMWSRDSKHIYFEYLGPNGHQICEMDVTDPSTLRPIFVAPRNAAPSALRPQEDAILLDSFEGTDRVLIAEQATGWKLRSLFGPDLDVWSGQFFDSGRFVVFAIGVADETRIAAAPLTDLGHRTMLTVEAVGTPNDIHAFWLVGDELLYASADGKYIRAAKLSATATGIVAGAPFTLFAIPQDNRGISPSIDGRQFLVATPNGPRQDPSILIVQGWERARRAH
jgi:dipeptidyl aminopeptidase/acylaminoacyl peptidase